MRARTNQQRIALAVLLIPGLACGAFAVLADVLRGGRLAADWGSGQTAVLCLAVVLILAALAIDGKARREQRLKGRPYGRTLGFLLVPIVVLLVLPLGIAEGIARWLPESHQTPSSFRDRHPQLGFALSPHRHYRAISRAKNFDVTVRTDGQGFRRGPGDTALPLTAADVVVVGDSHAFGFGVAEDQTLAAHLAALLQAGERPAHVINAGVPGFGLGQSLLRIESLRGLRKNAVVVVFVNPMNDLVNLSAMVDYHWPKPHPVLVDGALTFRPASDDWGDGPFLFSQPFASLNEFFQLADERRWYHSSLLRRVARHGETVSTVDGVTMLVDATPAPQYLADEARRITERPLLYASRFWPEMPHFQPQREQLAELVRAVILQMRQSAARAGWHLLVIVAPEAYAHQTYAKNYLRQIQEAVPEINIELGWSHQTVVAALEEASVATVVPQYEEEQVDALFLQNDDHTSAAGHRRIAELVFRQIHQQGWLQPHGDTQPAAGRKGGDGGSEKGD